MTLDGTDESFMEAPHSMTNVNCFDTSPQVSKQFQFVSIHDFEFGVISRKGLRPAQAIITP